MNTLQYELISNQAVAACGAAYFLALILNIAWWAATRREHASARSGDVRRSGRHWVTASPGESGA